MRRPVGGLPGFGEGVGLSVVRGGGAALQTAEFASHEQSHAPGQLARTEAISESENRLSLRVSE